MGNFGAWLFGITVGALALWGLGFIQPVDDFWTASHEQVVEWVQPATDDTADTE